MVQAQVTGTDYQTDAKEGGEDPSNVQTGRGIMTIDIHFSCVLPIAS